ncbi:1556_t:CDS:2 [Dentiscutata erythropus]|uniref:1556_t:CDS:1 n=1 Tax=Dentiscutata erythropus TaxID=1348616 RepID=A0A9N8VCQ9_9GLOM|nr:1556_t:CDS:2 [Dentiscutata erythropus]
MASSKFSEQLDTYLKDNSDIKIFDFPKHEKNLKCIGKGGFANVYSTTFEGENYALKSFKQSEELDENEFKDFMKELKMFHKVDDHPNVIKFYGISRNKLFDDFADSTNKGLDFSQISKRIRDIINLENQDPQNTFNCLYNKENNNNSEWLCLLGFFYLEGIGTEKNQITARDTFEKARNNTNGNFMAKFYLGECLRNAYGTEKNLASAKLLYKDIRGECARAANSLGLCYLKGIGYKTKKKAIKCFEESYKKGCISARNNLGNCYQFGRGTKKDEEKAFQYYLEAAEYGIIVAQYNTAECFRKGIGTAKNLDSAKQWYNNSAKNGHKNANNKLNSINRNQGVDSNQIFPQFLEKIHITR